MKFVQGGALIGHVGQHGTAGHHIGSGGVNPRKFFGGARDEGALLADAALVGKPRGVMEERGGKIGKYHMQRRTDALDGAEGNQAIAGADIHQGHAGLQLGPIEHPFADALDIFGDHALVGRIAAVPVLKQPCRPGIGGLLVGIGNVGHCL